MNLNSNLILAGQQPDMVNQLARSTRAAMLTNENQKRNRLATTYQEDGPAIMAGDTDAINRLAQTDLPQALQIQNQQRQFDFDERKFDFQVQQFAAQASAQQKAAAAEDARRDAFMLGAAQSPEEFDSIAEQIGEPDLIGGFEQRDLIVRKHMTAAELLKASAPEKPADEYGRYVAEETAAGRTPLSRIDYKKAAQKTTRTRVGADGSVEIVEDFGDSKTPPKLTVDAAKNTGFLIRTEEANQVLEELEGQGTRFGQQVLENVPLGLGNFGRDPEFQRFDQARRDFVNAILRRESGAVISDQEFDNANKQYFPVPGDSPEVIAQKRQNRINAIEGLRVGSGDGAAFVEQQKAREESSAIPDFKAMTDEQLDAWIAENGQ